MAQTRVATRFLSLVGAPFEMKASRSPFARPRTPLRWECDFLTRGTRPPYEGVKHILVSSSLGRQHDIKMTRRYKTHQHVCYIQVMAQTRVARRFLSLVGAPFEMKQPRSPFGRPRSEVKSGTYKTCKGTYKTATEMCKTVKGIYKTVASSRSKRRAPPSPGHRGPIRHM